MDEQLQLPLLNDTEFTCLLTVLVKNGYKLTSMNGAGTPLHPHVSRLELLGLIHSTWIHGENSRTALALAITPEGKAYIEGSDPVEVTRAFIRLNFTVWAQRWIREYVPVARLPEYLTHSIPDVRDAALERYEKVHTQCLTT